MADKNLRAFGSYLVHLRRQKGFSQARLVQAVNQRAGRQIISLRTIGRWETGDHEPYLSELAPVVAQLDGSIEEAAALIVGNVTRLHQEAA